MTREIGVRRAKNFAKQEILQATCICSFVRSFTESTRHRLPGPQSRRRKPSVDSGHVKGTAVRPARVLPYDGSFPGRPCRGASDGPNSTQVPAIFSTLDNGFAEPLTPQHSGQGFHTSDLPLPDLDLHVYKFKHPFIRSRVFRLYARSFCKRFDGLLAIVVKPCTKFVLNVVNLFELALELLDIPVKMSGSVSPTLHRGQPSPY